jgi:hypothetical protein
LLPRVSVLDEVDKQGFDSHGESIFRGQLQLGSSSGRQEKATIGPATRAGRRVRERESLGGATSVCFRGIQGVQVKGPKGAKSKAVEAIVLTSGKNKRKIKHTIAKSMAVLPMAHRLVLGDPPLYPRAL